MFNNQFNDRLAPLNEKHLAEVQLICPSQIKFAASIFYALKRNLNLQINLLVTIVLLKDIYDTGKRGVLSSFGDLLYVPLCSVSKTDHDEWTRYFSNEMFELYTSFSLFTATEDNVLSVNDVLSLYGLKISKLGKTGILFGNSKDMSSFEKSDFFQRKIKMMSYIESMGMPIFNVGFDKISENGGDLGYLEIEFYRYYEKFFEMMSYQPEESFVDNSAVSLWDSIVSSLKENSTIDFKVA